MLESFGGKSGGGKKFTLGKSKQQGKEGKEGERRGKSETGEGETR